MAVDGEILLDDERIRVRSLVASPGGRLCLPETAAGQLAVFIKGGVLTSEEGRSTVWNAGRVVWLSHDNPPLARRVNSGDAEIQLVHVTCKERAVGSPEHRYLNYPNIPGEDVLENEWVIVQRFHIAAGQWEGVHAHVANMLYIHVVGGQWAARSLREGERVYPGRSGDGTVGWMPPTDISEGHESGNVGESPIHLIWVTLKR